MKHHCKSTLCGAPLDSRAKAGLCGECQKQDKRVQAALKYLDKFNYTLAQVIESLQRQQRDQQYVQQHVRNCKMVQKADAFASANKELLVKAHRAALLRNR